MTTASHTVHADTLTQLAGFWQSSQGNQSQLFSLLLFVRLQTKQSLHFQLQPCRGNAYSAALSSSCYSLCLATVYFLLSQSFNHPLSNFFLHPTLTAEKMSCSWTHSLTILSHNNVIQSYVWINLASCLWNALIAQMAKIWIPLTSFIEYYYTGSPEPSKWQKIKMLLALLQYEV